MKKSVQLYHKKVVQPSKKSFRSEAIIVLFISFDQIIVSFQLFCLFLMITSSLLYASIFGHVTTIIHNMTLAAAKYHDMLNNVREFMVLNEVNKDIFEVLFPLTNQPTTRCLAISQNVSPITLSQSGQTLKEWSRIRWKSRL